MKLSLWIKEKKWRELDKSQWLMMILAGVLLFVIALPTGEDGETFFSGTEKEKQTEEATEIAEDAVLSDYEEKMEMKLQKALSSMEGAGRVEVMITVCDSGEDILAKDQDTKNVVQTENDQSGSAGTVSEETRSEETVYDSGENPVVTREILPRVEGVLVICEGAENTKVKQDIMEAVMALFQIESHKIKIVKMNVEAQADS